MARQRNQPERKSPDSGEQPVPDDTRARLMQAAAEAFAECGYHATTVRQICGRAGTNIALVNYYFRDKMGLYTEVLRQSARSGHLDVISEALDQNAPPEDVLRGVIRARLRGLSRGDLADQQFRILIRELAHPTPALARLINELARPIYNRLLEVIGRIAGLPATSDKTRLCVHSVMGQIMHYVLARPFIIGLWPEMKMTPEQLDRIADHIADFSLAYLRQVRAKPLRVATAQYRRNRR
jgi:AcrR family transcriptional regulator